MVNSILNMEVGKKRLLLKILKYIGISIAIVFVSICILILLVSLGAFGPLPDKRELSSINNEEASLVYSSDGVIIGKYFAENRTNIKWNEVPAHLKNALIATEDKRFFNHKGYDKWSYFRVFFRSILFGDRNGGGGSTLTQQLVKNLYGRGNYGFLSMPVNKIKEILIASKLEEIYTKEQLLLLYLNSVPFGEDVYGIESAAQRYFNKPTKELKIEESAVLVGLLRANTYFNPRLNPENSLMRRNLILSLMKNQHYLSERMVDSLNKLPLGLNYENLELENPAGYFVYQVKKKTQELLDAIKIKTGKTYNLEKDGLKIFTSLNMKIQELGMSSIKEQLGHMQPLLNKELENTRFKRQWYEKQRQRSRLFQIDTVKRKMELFSWEGFQARAMTRLDSLWHFYKMLNAAFLVTNPKDGSVLAWIGGNHFRTLPFDMVLSHRQIASAFKPVLYATALEAGIAPCSYLKNEVNEYPGYEDWEPQNADESSTPDSTVAVWYALAHSMNLPSVDLYFKVGGENLKNTCNKLDFPNVTDDTPSIAIGTLDLSLYEIVRAYGAFANQGQFRELNMIYKITDSEGNILYSNEPGEPLHVFTSETTQVITAILQEAINQGTGVKIRNTYKIKADLAGKTGTGQNYSDAWFIAYTPDIVIGTWVGASTPDIHFSGSNGSGSSLALPIVANVISQIEKNSSLTINYLGRFNLPEDVYAFLDCDPFYQTGLRGFVNRLFKRSDKKEKTYKEEEKNEKNKKEDKSFFNKIFKKQKKDSR